MMPRSLPPPRAAEDRGQHFGNRRGLGILQIENGVLAAGCCVVAGDRREQVFQLIERFEVVRGDERAARARCDDDRRTRLAKLTVSAADGCRLGGLVLRRCRHGAGRWQAIGGEAENARRLCLAPLDRLSFSISAPSGVAGGCRGAGASRSCRNVRYKSCNCSVAPIAGGPPPAALPAAGCSERLARSVSLWPITGNSRRRRHDPNAVRAARSAKSARSD